ncbi:N-ethylmaleimide reductase [Actinomadura pelletieri DSM 43383]|uniref:N-ethylmaleimide reductase n=1 Tax=Actinomadura pelletieri DSM 43383 TaxID=1120940 RepID=A0A495QYV8_9ACTN|nr:alkene reductase [Actinomadura pelletieri]RKS79399.1 N-ethylmaleimide reductase [Actinomadura pelletieri DSM 43383]
MTSPLLLPYDGPRLRLPNRIAMAPMTRARADDATGVPHALTKLYYAQRATAGLIVTEGIWPNILGKAGPGIPGLVTDAQVAGWAEVTEAVHAAGGTIFAQLWHVGRMTHPLNLPGGATPLAPSAVRIESERIYTAAGRVEHVTPRAMTTAEVEATIADFAAEARNAIRAGFDGVEVHGANGYLIQQFLAENTNRRTDRFGGSREGRLRLALDVVEAVVAEVGPERVGLRISPDNPENEIAEQDPQGTYRALVDAVDPLGLAYLHIIERGAYGALADLRPRWSGTLIGNFNGPEPTSRRAGEEAVAAGLADIFSFGRLFISNPDLPHRFATDAPLTPHISELVHGGDAEGYVDYPPASAEVPSLGG